MENANFARTLIEQLDHWVNDLAEPLMPPRVIPEGDDLIRLEFREHIPHAVMIGKSVRAVSGLRAALLLADFGYVTESAALLRMVSDFCSEIVAVGEALRSGGEIPKAVRQFVAEYFAKRARTPEQLAAEEKTRYVSRRELMKAEERMAKGANVDGVQLRDVHLFLS